MGSGNFLADDLAILTEFVDESDAELNKVASLFVELEKTGFNPAIINAIFRPIHSIKGNSAFLGLMKVRVLSHEMESLLDDIRKNRVWPTPQVVSLFLSGIDALKGMMARIRNQENEVADLQTFDALMTSIHAVQHEQLSAEDHSTPMEEGVAPPLPLPVAPPADLPAAPTLREAEAPARNAARSASHSAAGGTLQAGRRVEPALKQEPDRSIRIRESQLDRIESLLRELAQLHQAFQETAGPQAAALPAAAALTKHVAALGSLSGRLSNQLSSLRNIPLKELFQRVPRIVRDLSQSAGKAVEIHLSGEDILAPKSLIETLESPLTHLVRNALDHGIELPAERKKLGKSPAGHLWIEAKETPDALALRVADDGAGIDFKSLLKKALETGALKSAKALTPEDITNLIFLPGVSTAKKVTDVSGRGVGMDVVKHNVEAAGGAIKVASKPGKGAEFIIHLPK